MKHTTDIMKLASSVFVVFLFLLVTGQKCILDIGPSEGEGESECEGELKARVYVDQNAKGNGKGTSWKSACTTIEEGIRKASGKGRAEVLVAQGTYTSFRNLVARIPKNPLTQSIVTVYKLPEFG
ncbi:hypothetical protein ACFL1X_10265 [Candidatus Hydrogenedentota bacterium]